MAKRECPFCRHKKTSLHMVRKNKNSSKKVYRCRRCKKIFTNDLFFSKMRYDKRIILKSLKLYSEGLSYGSIHNYLHNQFNMSVERSTIFDWIQRYSQIYGKNIK